MQGMRKPAKPVYCQQEPNACARRDSSATHHRHARPSRHLHSGSSKRPRKSWFRFIVMAVSPFQVLFFVVVLWIVVQFHILSSFHTSFIKNEKSSNIINRSLSRGRNAVVNSLLNQFSLPQNPKQYVHRGLTSEDSNFNLPSGPNQDHMSDVHSLLESMNRPAIPNSMYNPKSTNPLPVVYICGPVPKNDNEEDWLLDALERSRYITVVAKLAPLNSTHIQHTQWNRLSPPQSIATSPPLTILVDWAGLRRDCHALHRILTLIQIQKGFKQIWKHQTPYLLLLDSTASVKVVTCSSDDRTFHNFNIRMAKRSIVEGRRWNYTRGWIEPGQIALPSSSSIPILQWTGSVSESFVKELRAVHNNDVDDSNNGDRTWDVSHFWQATTARIPRGGGIYNALRQTISQTLNDTAQETMIKYTDYVGFRSDIAVEIDIEGEKMEEEDDFEEMDARTTVLQLARSKIVVVSQSDEYEDHDDRLFEALASGALVLADAMVAPPPGLKNKTNIIFYNGTDMLDSLVRFYLKESEMRQKIARHGMQYALGRHRSWHVLEKLLFGRALTLTDKIPLDAKGPAKRKHAMAESSIVSLVL